MAISVNLPDGSVANFPDDTPPDAMKAAIQKRFPPMNVAGEVTAPFAGFNKGVDATLNIGSTLANLGISGINEGAGALGYEPPLPEGYFKPIPVATRANAGYEPQTLAGKVGEATGEVVGASVIPEAGIMGKATSMAPKALETANPILQKAATATAGDVAKANALPSLGAGVGITTARENDLGPVGETAAGLIGGFAVPNAINMASRTAGGVKAGLDYAGRQIERARDPEAAAYKDIADTATRTGLDLDQVHADVSPTPSPALAKKGLTSEDMADIVSRRLRGENAEDIGSQYGIHKNTVQKYVDDFQEANPTPRNLIDIGKEQLRPGEAQPLANQARADMAIADDPVAAGRLISRQREQPGRTADIIEQSSVNGRNFDQEIERLSGVAKQEEQAAYAKAREEAQPVKIDSVIRAARARHPMEGGQISNQMNKAIDLFFKGGMEEGAGDTLRYTKALDVVDDVPTYLRRRQELDQMIASSYESGRPTPLTSELTQFRQKLNAAARSNNESLRKADEQFAENRTTEKILQRGQEIGKRLTPQTKQSLRDFNKLTPTQRELQRVAFENKMATEALNVRRGHAAADQFNSEAFERIVDAMYPKSAGRDVFMRGRNLLQRLKTEAISTETNRDVLSGSRTAPLQNDIAAMMEGPRAAADLATGRFGKVLENLSNYLSRKIGKAAAEQRLRILTETDPAEMLPMLTRLMKEARSSAERDAYGMAIKQFMKVNRNPAVDFGSFVSSAQDGQASQ